MAGAYVVRAVALIAVAVGLSGCSLVHSAVVDPAGPVALAERNLLWWAFVLMMIVALPVFAMTAWFAIRYRASNERAPYFPDWGGSIGVEIAVWFVPAILVVAIGYLVWAYTHTLDPYKPLAAVGRPLKIQAIAQDWKWVFIYPGAGVASVNELAIPVGRPVQLEITSDTVMNALYIPRLAGQIYAMAGMRTELNLQADRAGRFTGRNSQYSGSGFSDQHFTVLAESDQDFKTWIGKAKASGRALDMAAYDKLARARATSPVMVFSTVAPGLFKRVIADHHGLGRSKEAHADVTKRDGANKRAVALEN